MVEIDTEEFERISEVNLEFLEKEGKIMDNFLSETRMMNLVSFSRSLARIFHICLFFFFFSTDQFSQLLPSSLAVGS